MKKILTTLAIVALAGAVQAQTGTVVFQQDFSAGGTTATYTGSGANQFDGITASGPGFTWAVNSNALDAARTANAGSLTRSTDLAITDGAIYKFTINVTDVSAAATTALTFMAGTGLTSANSVPANASLHSKFGINLSDATLNTYSFRNIGAGTNSTTFSGTASVFWVVNNSGTSLSYTAPDTTTAMVANDTWDLWIGNTEVFAGAAATTATQGLTDFKLVWDGGTGTITFDNFEVRSLMAVPEPATTALFGVGVLIGAQRLIRRKRS